MTLHEIILRITGRANVKPAVDQAKREVQRGFAASDLLTGKGGEQAMKALRGGLVAMGLRIGYEIGTKINGGIDAALASYSGGAGVFKSIGAGFQSLWYDYFQKPAIDAMIAADRRAADLAERIRRDARGAESYRLKLLNQDLDDAIKRSNILQKLNESRSKAAGQVERAQYDVSIARAEANGDPVEVMRLKQEAEQKAAARSIEERRAALASERSEYTDIAAALVEQAGLYQDLGKEIERYRQLQNPTTEQSNEASNIMARMKALREYIDATTKAQQQKDAGIETLKIEIAAEERKLQLLREQQAVEMDTKKAAEEQAAQKRTQEVVQQTLTDQVRLQAEAAQEKLAAIDEQQANRNEQERQLSRDASLLETKVNTQRERFFDRDADKEARRGERAEKRRNDTLQRQAENYNKRLERLTRGKSDDEVAAITARLAGGRGARAAKLFADQEALKQKRQQMEQLEIDAMKAEQESRDLLKVIKGKFEMPQ